VTDLAAASIAAAGLAISELIARAGGVAPSVAVDRRLASFWFGTSLRPQGWAPPPPWDPIAGDYATSDGWIRLHTNAPHHRRAALNVLGVDADKNEVARAVAGWSGDELESAVVANGGCAARMRSLEEWAAHDQGRSVAAEPLIDIRVTEEGAAQGHFPDPSRPLKGLRVLDLTRVLAGPVATRFLAGYGAEALRIDPPDWDEPAVIPEVMPGKKTARLDLRKQGDRAVLLDLIGQSDILIHGYRSDALERLGLGAEVRRRMRPGLIDVSLDAYGWSGPWRARRGFDSLVRMSAGVAEAGMRRLARDRPTPLPVQALDHATGYMLAAAALLGLVTRLETGRGSQARASLARTALLLSLHSAAPDATPVRPEEAADLDDRIEETVWGSASMRRAGPRGRGKDTADRSRPRGGRQGAKKDAGWKGRVYKPAPVQSRLIRSSASDE
jgi:crotonobetainyl-CoA:carnitine CoA-transferase CaiB-like acyl-CoA transferase